MPARCCAHGCPSGARWLVDPDISFYRLPQDQNRRKLWLSAVRLPGQPSVAESHARVCSRHFISGAPHRDPLNPDYLPTVAARSSKPRFDQHYQQRRFDRYGREKVRLQKAGTRATGIQTDPVIRGYFWQRGTQTDLTADWLNALQHLPSIPTPLQHLPSIPTPLITPYSSVATPDQQGVKTKEVGATSIDTHWAALQGMCRICGEDATASGRLVADLCGTSFKKKMYSSEIDSVFGIDIEQDLEGVHPPDICTAHHAALCRYRQCILSGDSFQTETSCVYDFQPHGEDCAVCQQAVLKPDDCSDADSADCSMSKYSRVTTSSGATRRVALSFSEQSLKEQLLDLDRESRLACLLKVFKRVSSEERSVLFTALTVDVASTLPTAAEGSHGEPHAESSAYAQPSSLEPAESHDTTEFNPRTIKVEPIPEPTLQIQPIKGEKSHTRCLEDIGIIQADEPRLMHELEDPNLSIVSVASELENSDPTSSLTDGPCARSTPPSPGAEAADEQEENNNSSLQCSYCDKVFVSKNSLKRHTKRHTGEAIECFHCHKTFTTKSHLKEHVERTHLRLTHPCTECDMMFVTKLGLKRHIQGHTDQYQHRCDICGKGFAYQSMVVTHVGKHHGEKPHACPTCGKAFLRSPEMRNHTETCGRTDRPFACTVCGKLFKAQRYLTAHGKTHGTDSYQCVNCGKQYKLRSSFSKHAKSCH